MALHDVLVDRDVEDQLRQGDRTLLPHGTWNTIKLLDNAVDEVAKLVERRIGHLATDVS